MKDKDLTVSYPFSIPEGSHKIVLKNVLVMCSACNRVVPMADVGLRNMGDGTIRNQPRCMPCRKRKDRGES